MVLYWYTPNSEQKYKIIINSDEDWGWKNYILATLETLKM